MHLRSARLYTRGPESVRLELREEPTRFMIVEHGPGQKWSHQMFALYSEALKFQAAREQQLVAERFALEGVEEFAAFRRTTAPGRRKTKQVVPHDWERRSGEDRRSDEFLDID
jgi:hypothetical protein